ncbi:fused MFS/spermidine synthase [Sporichthya sp.]|uniref:fused MFS/spermidine synthase n=1 Tax=Sporichthya sp. TaxID=65475 RepID=UPI00179DA651|nr:fused MFS/spermidine synthase [Sporichthya sp.]MBA3743448.1 fused MFS/spermidine synthase [Sporichthya sp.]
MSAVLAGALVFLCSAAVLMLEILSLRLVAPYAGITLEVSTAVIGFALAAIALGAWLGGIAADHIDPRRMLGPVIIAAGGLMLLVVPTVRATGEAISGNDDGAVLTMAAVAVLFPAALLSAVSPMVVKTQLGSLERTGSVVGMVSGTGTVGALVGTFITGFLLVSSIPTSRILYSLGIALIVLGIAVAGRARLKVATAGGTTAAMIGAGAFVIAPQPCDTETAYHCAKVVVDPDNPTGRTLQLDTLRHSYVDLADPKHLEFTYIRAFGALIDAMRPTRQSIRALHIGGGGATLPRYVDATRPGSDNLIVEIDEGVIDIDRKELGLVTGNGIEVQIRDGRTGLRAEPDGGRDLVVMDAFGGIAVPWHLTTREVVQDARRVLGTDGLYLVNVIDYWPSDFARAEVATVASVFRNVALVSYPSVFDATGGGNILIVASDAPLPSFEDAIAERAREYTVRSGEDVEVFARDADVLRDDFAPVDQLITTPAG